MVHEWLPRLRSRAFLFAPAAFFVRELRPCHWWRLIFEGWPRRKPFSRAEKPPIAFIRELKKQVRVGPNPAGEGQFAISDRAKVAHGNSNPNATRIK